MTQEQRVLRMLRAAGKSGVFSHDFYAEFMPRAGARILDLKEKGFVISSTPERRNGKPGTRYRLLKEPIGGPSTSGPQAPDMPGKEAPDSTEPSPADSSGDFDWDAFRRQPKHDQLDAA